jgi:hypothetical protein
MYADIDIYFRTLLEKGNLSVAFCVLEALMIRSDFRKKSCSRVAASLNFETYNLYGCFLATVKA